MSSDQSFPGGREPVSVSDSLDRWRRQLGLAAPSTMARITAVWADVMGPLATDVEPRAVVDGTLRTVVRDPAVAEAVRWRSSAVIDELGRRLEPGLVTRVEVRVQR